MLLPVGTAAARGPDSDCLVDGRTYRIRLPENPAGRVGAILFLHGHGGHAADNMDDEELARDVSGLGLAPIAARRGTSCRTGRIAPGE